MLVPYFRPVVEFNRIVNFDVYCSVVVVVVYMRACMRSCVRACLCVSGGGGGGGGCRFCSLL